MTQCFVPLVIIEHILKIQFCSLVLQLPRPHICDKMLHGSYHMSFMLTFDQQPQDKIDMLQYETIKT